MKKFIKLTLIFLFPILGWSQMDLSKKTIEINYVKAYKNFKDFSNSPPSILRNIEYKLVFNNNEARFEYIPNMSNDGDDENIRFIGRGGGSGINYKNLKSKEKIHQTEIGGKTYIITNDYDKYDWKLLKDTKKIIGYDCYKAIGIFKEYSEIRKKDIIIEVSVWYAPSLAIPFGPAGYDGLPGIVLESSMSSFYLIATDIKFHDNPLKIKKPQDGIMVTNEEFNRILNKIFLSLGK